MAESVNECVVNEISIQICLMRGCMTALIHIFAEELKSFDNNYENAGLKIKYLLEEMERLDIIYKLLDKID